MSAQRDWTINQDSEGIKIEWRMGHRQGRGVHLYFTDAVHKTTTSFCETI